MFLCVIFFPILKSNKLRYYNIIYFIGNNVRGKLDVLKYKDDIFVNND